MSDGPGEPIPYGRSLRGEPTDELNLSESAAQSAVSEDRSGVVHQFRSGSIQADLSGLAKEIGVGSWVDLSQADVESLESVLQALHEIDPELVSVFIKQQGAELAFGNWETDLIA